MLPFRWYRTPQCRVLVGIRRENGAPAEQPCPVAVDNVRPRHGCKLAREEDDRLGERRPAHPRRGGELSHPLLLLRGVQSVQSETDPGRGPGQYEVTRECGILVLKPEPRGSPASTDG